MFRQLVAGGITLTVRGTVLVAKPARLIGEDTAARIGEYKSQLVKLLSDEREI